MSWPAFANRNYPNMILSCDCPTCEPEEGPPRCDDDCTEQATVFLKVQAGQPGSWYNAQYCNTHSEQPIGQFVREHMNANWIGETVVITDRESKIGG